MGKRIGEQYIMLLYGVSEADNIEKLKQMNEHILKELKVTELASYYKKFEPQGASGISLISESHTAFHTWPEYNFITIDIFTCGKESPEKVVPYILDLLKPERYEIIIMTHRVNKTIIQRRKGHGKKTSEQEIGKS